MYDIAEIFLLTFNRLNYKTDQTSYNALIKQLRHANSSLNVTM